jgi:EmrB/QacA subfamily drug resistance transporter
MTSTDPNYERRWTILGVIGVAQLLVVLDVTIVNIALPSAQADLGFGADDRQWIITAYALSFGSLLLLGGRIADLFGRKWAFITGLLGFAVASALGGAAGSFGVLVAARALQGAFAALLAPAALSLLATTFTDPKERAKAFGIYGAIAGSGGAVGLLLGGALTDLLSWRWCLYVALLFAIPAAIGGARLLTHRPSPHRPRIDVPGVLLASAGVFSLVLGLSQAETEGWTAPVTLVLLAVGLLLLAAFWATQQRVAHPLLPPRVVLDRNRGGSYFAIAVSGAGIFGVFLFLTFYLQQTKGMSPFETGLAFLPMNLSIITTATLVNTRVLARTGPRPLIPTGMALAALAMVYLAQLEVDSTYAAHVLPALIVNGIGFGLIFAPSFATGTSGVAPQDTGVASATLTTCQQVGGSIGTALLSTIAVGATADFIAANGRSPQVAAQAALEGYVQAFWWAAGLLAVGALITRLLLRPGRPTGAVAPVEAREAAAA